MAATRTLDRRRQLFPTLESGVYLLSHSLGPAPATLDESMRAYLDEWRHHTTEDAWGAKWWELSRDVGDRIGRLIGAQPGSVQMQPSASVALYAVLSCFDFSRPGKNQVVTTALDFPSMGYIWEGQRHLGADVQVVASENDIVIPMDRLLEAITDRTVLVALSHVSYRSSSRIDVEAVVRRTHEVGAFVVLDAYQSVGILSMDVQRWNVDFLIGGSIKWLCGGPSCGYLYVRPDLIGQFQPRLTGWIAHADPFAFSHEGMKYDQSVRRFAQGTPSIPALYSFLPGLRIIEDVGLDAIERESRRRTRRIVAFAQEHGWRLHSPLEVEQRGGTVMIEVDDPERQVEALAKRGVFVDCRPGVGLRVSPHFFNTDEEVEQALETIGSVIP